MASNTEPAQRIRLSRRDPGDPIEADLLEGGLKTWTWLNGGTAIAEVGSEDFFVLNCPVGLVLLVPSDAVFEAGVPTC